MRRMRCWPPVCQLTRPFGLLDLPLVRSHSRRSRWRIPGDISFAAIYVYKGRPTIVETAQPTASRSDSSSPRAA